MHDNDGHEVSQDLPSVEAEPQSRSTAARVTIVGTAVGVFLVAALGVWAVRDDGSSSTGRALPALPLLVTGAQSERSAAADAKAFAPIEYALAADLPDLGSTGLVYRVGAPRPAADAATAIAASLGIEGQTVERDGIAEVVGADRTVTVSTYGPLSVSIYQSVVTGEPARGASEPGAGGGSSAGGVAVAGDDGSTAVSKEAPDVVETPAIEAPKNLPSAANAEHIARELLNRIGVEGDYEAAVSDSGTVGVATACAPNTDCSLAPESTVTSRSVTLFRTIDGRRVSGLEWYIEVGDEGVVGSANGTWAAVETVGDYPLRSVGAAYEALRRGEVAGGRDLVAQGSGDENVGAPAIEPSPDVSVERLRVVISGATRGAIFMTAYDAGGAAAYVVPSYRFEGTYPDGTLWSAEVLAVDEKYVVTPSTTAPPSADEREPSPAPQPQPEPDAVVPEPATASFTGQPAR
jgi:hypothetical protein